MRKSSFTTCLSLVVSDEVAGKAKEDKDSAGVCLPPSLAWKIRDKNVIHVPLFVGPYT